jgi:predicted house-cleaning NTP pyrophosphatase (Maf/HAM1 superfamily)
MNARAILDTIKRGVEFVEGLKPALAMIPGVGPLLTTAVSAAGAVTEVVNNIKERVDEGKIVFSSTDQSEIKGYVQRLERVNDELAAYIDQT